MKAFRIVKAILGIIPPTLSRPVFNYIECTNHQWMEIMFYPCSKIFLCALVLPSIMAAQIDTNQVIDVKHTSIAGIGFKYFRSGVIRGVYTVGICEDKLYAVDAGKKVRPYLITSYDFSYMDKKNIYRTISCTGNTLDPRIPPAIAEVPNGLNIYIDNIFAIQIYTNSQTRIGGATLMKP